MSQNSISRAWFIECQNTQTTSQQQHTSPKLLTLCVLLCTPSLSSSFAIRTASTGLVMQANTIATATATETTMAAAALVAAGAVPWHFSPRVFVHSSFLSSSCCAYWTTTTSTTTTTTSTTTTTTTTTTPTTTTPPPPHPTTKQNHKKNKKKKNKNKKKKKKNKIYEKKIYKKL